MSVYQIKANRPKKKVRSTILVVSKKKLVIAEIELVRSNEIKTI